MYRAGQVAFSVSLWGQSFGLVFTIGGFKDSVSRRDLFLGLWSVSRISICRMIDGKTGPVGRVRGTKQQEPVFVKNTVLLLLLLVS